MMNTSLSESKSLVVSCENKESKNKGNEKKSHISVFVRLRPALADTDFVPEHSVYRRNVVRVDKEAKCVYIRSSEFFSNEERGYPFTDVFPPESTQQELFQQVAQPVVDSLFSGRQGTILAYGQTGTGKTYTLANRGEEGKKNGTEGLVTRCTDYIFGRMWEDREEYEYTLSVNMVQIYKEMIQDLLDITKKDLVIREDTEKGVYLSGVTSKLVHTGEQLLNLFDECSKHRVVALTNLNAESSRSHLVLMLHVLKRRKVTEKDIVDASQRVVLKGKLTLVDLSGSERLKKTGAEGIRRQEAQSINLSLSCLGNVIHALSDPKATHIPYRESKLTRLLQESLGGHGKTSIIVTIGPNVTHVSETMSSLLFGQRAMRVPQTDKIHMEVDYKALALKLQLQLDQTEGKLRLYEGMVSELEEQQEEVEKLVSAKEQLEAEIGRMTRSYEAEVARLQAVLQGDMQKAEEERQCQLDALQQEKDAELNRIQQEHEKQLDELQADFACSTQHYENEIVSLQSRINELAIEKELDAIRLRELELADLTLINSSCGSPTNTQSGNTLLSTPPYNSAFACTPCKDGYPDELTLTPTPTPPTFSQFSNSPPPTPPCLSPTTVPAAALTLDVSKEGADTQDCGTSPLHLSSYPSPPSVSKQDKAQNTSSMSYMSATESNDNGADMQQGYTVILFLLSTIHTVCSLLDTSAKGLQNPFFLLNHPLPVPRLLQSLRAKKEKESANTSSNYMNCSSNSSCSIVGESNASVDGSIRTIFNSVGEKLDNCSVATFNVLHNALSSSSLAECTLRHNTAVNLAEQLTRMLSVIGDSHALSRTTSAERPTKDDSKNDRQRQQTVGGDTTIAHTDSSDTPKSTPTVCTHQTTNCDTRVEELRGGGASTDVGEGQDDPSEVSALCKHYKCYVANAVQHLYQQYHKEETTKSTVTATAASGGSGAVQPPQIPPRIPLRTRGKQKPSYYTPNNVSNGQTSGVPAVITKAPTSEPPASLQQLMLRMMAPKSNDQFYSSAFDCDDDDLQPLQTPIKSPQCKSVVTAYNSPTSLAQIPTTRPLQFCWDELHHLVDPWLHKYSLSEHFQPHHGNRTPTKDNNDNRSAPTVTEKCKSRPPLSQLLSDQKITTAQSDDPLSQEHVSETSFQSGWTNELSILMDCVKNYMDSEYNNQSNTFKKSNGVPSCGTDVLASIMNCQLTAEGMGAHISKVVQGLHGVSLYCVWLAILCDTLLSFVHQLTKEKEQLLNLAVWFKSVFSEIPSLVDLCYEEVKTTKLKLQQSVENNENTKKKLATLTALLEKSERENYKAESINKIQFLQQQQQSKHKIGKALSMSFC